MCIDRPTTEFQTSLYFKFISRLEACDTHANQVLFRVQILERILKYLQCRLG